MMTLTMKMTTVTLRAIFRVNNRLLGRRNLCSCRTGECSCGIPNIYNLSIGADEVGKSSNAGCESDQIEFYSPRSVHIRYSNGL